MKAYIFRQLGCPLVAETVPVRSWSAFPEVLEVDVLLLKMHSFHVNPGDQLVQSFQPAWATYFKVVFTSVLYFPLSFFSLYV